VIGFFITYYQKLGMETTRQQLNILFVSATVPYPAIDGGRIRVLNLLRHLHRIHKVTFLCLITSPMDEQGAQYLRETGIDVVSVRWERSILRYAFLLQSIIHGKPLTVAKYYSRDMMKSLESLLKLRDFDIVHFEMLHTGQYLSDLSFPKTATKAQRTRRISNVDQVTVLDEQNIDSAIWHRLVKTEPNPLKKLIFYWQYRSFLNYERWICKKFDICTCVSSEDGDRLASLCSEARIEVVPNGVDPDYFKPLETEENETQLVFTGSMDWLPNEDAVLYFCDRILPLIRAELPEMTFHIVGSNPTDRVLNLRKTQGVFVTGLVEDVRPYMASAAVYVVPLRVGGGTRLKILQALAMKKAVVSTSIGCEGLDVKSGENILVADDPQQFAKIVIRLARDRSLRRGLGENGRTLVQENYDWSAIVRKLDSVYRLLK